MKKLIHLFSNFLFFIVVGFLSAQIYESILVPMFIDSGLRKIATDEGMTVSPFRPIDVVIDKMVDGKIVFITPNNLNLNETKQVELYLNLSEIQEKLKKLLHEEVKKYSKSVGVVKVGNIMQARLSGHNFQITSITPDIQAVSSSKTVWKWEVTPKTQGKHTINLSLSAIVQLDGQETNYLVKFIRKTIVVSLTPFQHVSLFIDRNWQWLWAAILLPLARVSSNYTRNKKGK